MSATRIKKPLTKSQAVKLEAGRRINARYPLWRQLNMAARGVELTDIRLNRDPAPEEEAEAQTLREAKAWIDAVRAASDVLEADPGLGSIDIASWPGWPE